MIWQTRTLATFIAVTVPTEEGEESPVVQAALSIGQPSDDSTDKPTPAPRAEPAVGSYEKFMVTFGRSMA